MTREELFNMRHNEFGFSPIHNLCKDVDYYPNKFHIVKWVKTEPREVFSITLNKKVLSTSYNYAIAELEWDDHEPCWEFKSIGTRYLEDSTPELNKWILDFCNKYQVVDNEIVEVYNEEF